MELSLAKGVPFPDGARVSKVTYILYEVVYIIQSMICVPFGFATNIRLWPRPTPDPVQFKSLIL